MPKTNKRIKEKERKKMEDRNHETLARNYSRGFCKWLIRALAFLNNNHLITDKPTVIGCKTEILSICSYTHR